MEVEPIVTNILHKQNFNQIVLYEKSSLTNQIMPMK